MVTIPGTAGKDTIQATGDEGHVDGGDGDDRSLGGDGRDVLRGGAGSDPWLGNESDDRLEGGNGYDEVGAGTILDGGPGSDTMRGAGRLIGRDGDDLSARFSRCRILLGAGLDRIDLRPIDPIPSRDGDQRSRVIGNQAPDRATEVGLVTIGRDLALLAGAGPNQRVVPLKTLVGAFDAGAVRR